MSIVHKFGAAAVAVVASVGLLTAAPVGATAATAAAAAAPVKATVVTTATIRTAAVAPMTLVPGRARIDTRCMTGRTLCINKATRKLYFLVNGRVVSSADARFGCPSTPTHNGSFKIYWKSRYHVSSLYHSSMPWAMFFNGGQAVHYSADFAARGYNGCSHGCVNIRNKTVINYIYYHVKVGDKVIVYRA